MSDAFIAHVRFVDHVARCPECHRLGDDMAAVCPTGRNLLVTWQRAQQLATLHAEEVDRAEQFCAEEGGRPA